MSLTKDILIKLFEKENIHVTIGDFDKIMEEAFESECLKALKKIQAIIKNNDLSYYDCIKSIDVVFEDLGSDGGVRHDFG